MRVSSHVGISFEKNMSVREVMPEIAQGGRTERLACLRESALQNCARLALERTVVTGDLAGTTVESRLRSTTEEILALAAIARKLYEGYSRKSESPKGLRLNEDEILEMLFQRSSDDTRPQFIEETRTQVEKDILAQEPQRLGRRLSMSDPHDVAYDTAARNMLEHLDGVEVEDIKRYRRYSFTLAMNNPRYNLQMAILRREITPDDNPIPVELAAHIEDPHGVHYSVVFEAVEK